MHVIHSHQLTENITIIFAWGLWHALPFFNHSANLFHGQNQILHRWTVAKANIMNTLTHPDIADSAWVQIKEDARNTDDLMLDAFL